MIYDVDWSKPDAYHYVVWQVTKAGELFKRGTTWMWPSHRVRILACDLPLPDETLRLCDGFRRYGQALLENVNGAGVLDEILKRVEERRKYRGY